MLNYFNSSRILTGLSLMLIVVMMLLSLTACSRESKIVTHNFIIPDVPVFSGNCGHDLNTLIEEYVLPIEAQKGE